MIAEKWNCYICRSVMFLRFLFFFYFCFWLCVWIANFIFQVESVFIQCLVWIFSEYCVNYLILYWTRKPSFAVLQYLWWQMEMPNIAIDSIVWANFISLIVSGIFRQLLRFIIKLCITQLSSSFGSAKLCALLVGHAVSLWYSFFFCVLFWGFLLWQPFLFAVRYSVFI